MTSKSTLASIPLFSELSDRALQALSSGAITRRYKKNRVLIEEGDTSTSLYLVISGKLQVYLSDEEGKEVILNTLRPGDYFGELSLIDNEPRSASVLVQEDSELSMISRELFEQVVKQQPEIERSLLLGMAKRIRELSSNYRDLALLDVYGRVANLVSNMAEEQQGRLITEQIIHQDIANRVGSSREMVSRILKDLRVGGYIEIEKKRIIILKKLPDRW